MKKQVLLLFILMSLPMVASADAVEIDGIYYNLIIEEKVAEVTSNPNKYTGSVTIPATVEYENVTYNVTSIGGSAFRKCSGLISVTIPNGVIIISDWSFAYCSSLISVSFPNTLTTIGWAAFFECSGLSSIYIPNSVTNIGSSAFEGCAGLNSIVVSEGNTVYDSRENCNAIIETSSNTLLRGCNNTIIPNSITGFQGGAFYNCKGLTSVTIPDGVTNIPQFLFEKCTGLISVTIGNSVTSIGNFTFRDCTGLTSVTIGNSVTSIGYGAFSGCTGLNRITCRNTIPPICASGSEDPFKGVDHTIPVYVPKGSILKYKAADSWRNFVVFREIGDEDEDVLLTISDGGNGKTQLLVDESKPYFTLLFKADNGWKLHSVTFNDDDVTAEVSENGQYTTPALTASSTLTVVYEESSAQSVSAAFKSSVQVRANRGELIVSNPTTSALSVTVYELNGTQVLQQPLTGAETRITLPEGHVYVVNVGSQTFKVGL